MNHALFSQMAPEDWKRIKVQMQEDLRDYYSKMGGIWDCGDKKVIFLENFMGGQYLISVPL